MNTKSVRLGETTTGGGRRGKRRVRRDEGDERESVGRVCEHDARQVKGLERCVTKGGINDYKDRMSVKYPYVFARCRRFGGGCVEGVSRSGCVSVSGRQAKKGVCGEGDGFDTRLAMRRGAGSE